MAYPTRRAWVFRNITRDFTYWPLLDSVGISQEYPDMTATFSARVVDGDEGYVFEVEDEHEVTFGGARIWAGHVKSVTEEALAEHGPRSWLLDGQDYTAKLADAIVRRRRKRKGEKAKRRVRWLLKTLERRVWDLAGRDLDDIPDERVEPYDYYGASIAEALAHVGDEIRTHSWIDLDDVFWMVRSETVAAPFGLDNDAPDFVTTFPFREWSWAEDSVELANAILVAPEKRKHSRWSKDATSIAAYGRQERFVSDGNLHRPAQAERVGTRTLGQAKDPETEGRLVVDEPGIWAGMTVQLTDALWGHDEDVFVRAVEIEAVGPHDADGTAYLRSTLTVSDKRRPKLRGSGGHGPDGSTNKVTRLRPSQTADTELYPLDTFGRIVEPPTWSAGSSIVSGPLLTTWSARRGVTVAGADMGFSLVPGAAPWRVQSTIGQWYLGWTHPDNPCSRMDNHWAGWLDFEHWFVITIPTHPGSMAGITVGVRGLAGPPGSLATCGGVAQANGYEVVTRTSAPTDTWQGAPVGLVPTLDSTWYTVFVPATQVPAAGGSLWIGVRPAWRCEYGETECGWVWPYASGVANSGRGTTEAQDATWAVWSAAGGDMGSLEIVETAPWEGGNAWREAGTEGSPTYGVDGGAYYVQAEEPGGRGLYVVGEREDEDEPWGPWSDTAWGVQLTFQVDAHGNTGAAGRRQVEVTTSGEGEQVKGYVHLGDGSRAEGISVSGPTTTDYAAQALTLDEPWRVRFDCRSNRMRGKLWRVADGEPAAWDVEVPMAETEDDADRFLLWVRVGNGTGASQTVRIRRIDAQQGAADGQRLVREWIGHASGSEHLFKTSHPFREGTLRLHVNGVGVAPVWEDGDATEVRIDYRPTAGSAIRATYIVDQGE